MNSLRLIDVREFPEFAPAHIANSELVPLSTLATVAATWVRTGPVTLICKSGSRAGQAKSTLTAMGFTGVDVLAGGIDAWSAAGKPLLSTERRPWSLERQVRITAGALVLLTLALALTLSRYLLFATAFVGAGLVFAGVSDICMMATLLGRMPWNRPASRTAKAL